MYLRQTRNDLVGKRNVLLLGLLLGGTLEILPGVPLVLALEVKDAGLGGLIVANGSLLVESVELEQLVVGGSLGELVDLVSLERKKRWG